ncbi:MAG: 4'-phosphopantetheinyl transferase family protein [Oscillospiraceae bacterium]|jgi:phosphopantetheinyl transferase
MELFYSDIRGLDESEALYPGRSGRRGSAFGVSLLAYAVKQVWGSELPQIGITETGKPYFIDRPKWHFSVSHSRSHVFCALSEFPVGVDVETRREMRPAYIRRLTRDFDPGELDIFQLWVLRESLFKLTGQGDLRSMPFSQKGGVIYPPVFGVNCRLYDDIPGCAAAVCAFHGTFPEKIRFVPSKLICS